jgi:hypothetical protein
MIAQMTNMEPTTLLIWAFIALSLAIKFAWEKIELFLHSNFKYRVIDSLSFYVYYGDDNGIDASLKLDSPSPHILKRRMEGQNYLESKLAAVDATKASTFRGPKCASSLVDCRFALAKVCMPLLRELEFPNAGRNFVSEVCNNESDGMLMVTTEDGVSRPFVGNDAVHTFGVKTFYAPVQTEINRRMALDGNDNKDSMLRFCPISMNSELDKNVSLVKKLTGMDKVRYSLSGKYIGKQRNIFLGYKAVANKFTIFQEAKPWMPLSKTSRLRVIKSHLLCASRVPTMGTCRESTFLIVLGMSFFLNALRKAWTSSNVITIVSLP